jgi:hypothetical protein
VIEKKVFQRQRRQKRRAIDWRALLILMMATMTTMARTMILITITISMTMTMTMVLMGLMLGGTVMSSTMSVVAARCGTAQCDVVLPGPHWCQKHHNHHLMHVVQTQQHDHHLMRVVQTQQLDHHLLCTG